MKCPFRTVTQTQTNPRTGSIIVSTDYSDCIGTDCPYFGKPVKRFSDASLRWETVIKAECRRTEAKEV